MKYRFKSTINCKNCRAKVAPVLDGDERIENWEVDLDNPDKILTVEVTEIDPDDISRMIRKTGFKLEQIEDPS